MKRVFTQCLLPLFVSCALGAVTVVQAEVATGVKQDNSTKQHAMQTLRDRHSKQGRQKTESAASDKTTAAVSPVNVTYDKASDQLRVSAAAGSLKAVLGKIAMQSGIEVLFDDAAEEVITFDMKSAPLESGVTSLLKGRNYSLRYSSDKKGKQLLVAVTVLAKGEVDVGRAKRLTSMEREAYGRAKSQDKTPKTTAQRSPQNDVSKQRWQARLNELPAKQRDELEKKARKRLEQDAKRQQSRAEMSEKRKQKAAERDANKQKEQEARMQLLDPEERAAFEQESAAAKKEMKEKLLNNAAN